MTTGERSEGEYNRLWETNVVGTFLISKRLAPLMNKGAPLQPCTACLFAHERTHMLALHKANGHDVLD